MTILKGSRANREFEGAQQARREEAKAGRVPWAKFPVGTSTFRPLQEIDEDSPDYSAKNGQAIWVLEHQGTDWRRTGQCTADTGECKVCEAYRDRFPNGGGFRQRKNMYINVLMNDEEGEEVVRVLRVSRTLEEMLLEMSTDAGSITNRLWKVKRVGTGKDDTKYTFMPVTSESRITVEDYELFDLEKVVREVPVEEQEEYFGLNAKMPEEETESAPKVAEEDKW